MSAEIVDLRESSGLTWLQLAWLMGTSARTVHMWAAGKSMPSWQASKLLALISLVAAAPCESPEARRAWLFAPTAGGGSPLETFMQSHRKTGAPLQGSGYTPAGLLGIA